MSTLTRESDIKWHIYEHLTCLKPVTTISSVFFMAIFVCIFNTRHILRPLMFAVLDKTKKKKNTVHRPKVQITLECLGT